MSDLFLNGDFEVEISGNGDLRTVDGYERLKQSIAVHVTASMYNKVGEAMDVKKQLRLSVNRALRTHSLLNEVKNVQIQRAHDAGVYEVTIGYQTDAFSFEVET